MRLFMRGLAAAIVCSLTVPLFAVGGAPGPRLPRVYVYTSELGDPDDVRERQRSVQDVLLSLAGKSKHLVLIDDRTQSDIAVAVIERTVAHPKAGIRVFPPMVNGPAFIVQLRVRLTRGDESLELAPARWHKVQSDQAWTSAANDTAALIDKWIVDHPLRSSSRGAGPSGVMKQRLRALFCCAVLELGALTGIPMRPDEIRDLRHHIVE